MKKAGKILPFCVHNKVFVHLFQKVPHSKARSLCRAPQSAKSHTGVFFFVAFSFAPAYAKEKADSGLVFLFRLLAVLGFCAVGANIVRPQET